MKVGDSLPVSTFPAVDGAASTLFSGSSWALDASPRDFERARGAGASDTVAPAMLSLAYLGRFLTDQFDQTRLRHLAAHFVGAMHDGDEIWCKGLVAELFDAGCERRARLEIAITNQFGERKIVGEAVVSL